jgi:glycosyltransferase involved in cell wall biosynthesis
VTGEPLKVIINAQLPLDGSGGGVQQFTTSLIGALGRLTDGTEEYIIVGSTGNSERLSNNLGPNQRVVQAPAASFLQRSFSTLMGPFKNIVAAAHCAIKSYRPTAGLISVPASGGFYESLGGDLIHFPYQAFCRTALPSIYNPHDLLHLHYPQFLSSAEVVYREVVYRSACNESSAVVVESEWVRGDIVERYGLKKRKIKNIFMGSPTELYSDISEETLRRVKSRFTLPDSFAFYPAQTWPHKNHMRLVDAVKLVRDSRGINVNVVCAGHKNDHWPVIEQRVKELGVEDLISFLGFVNETELRALYRLAQFVVFPSLFEGGGFPVLEAFTEMTPLACSTATSLPEYAGQAALFFDASSAASIASALERMVTDQPLRMRLRQEGIKRAGTFDWGTTAKTYRAVYREVAGRELTEEDQCLLDGASGENDATNVKAG